MRWARRSAWLLGAATLVLAAAGLALMAWDWSTPGPRGFFGIRGFAVLYAIGFGGIGAVLTWRRPGDTPREELIQALDALTSVLLPHLDREVAEAMPVVSQTLTAREWEAWNKQTNVKGKPLRELGLEGHWLIDEIDPEGYQVVADQVPAVPRFILLHGFARPYRRRRDGWWSPQVMADRGAASP